MSAGKLDRTFGAVPRLSTVEPRYVASDPAFPTCSTRRLRTTFLNSSCTVCSLRDEALSHSTTGHVAVSDNMAYKRWYVHALTTPTLLIVMKIFHETLQKRYNFLRNNKT